MTIIKKKRTEKIRSGSEAVFRPGTYIYIGRPINNLQHTLGPQTRIQLNDKFGSVADIIDYVSAERERMSPEDQQQMTVSVKADQSTKMGVINDVKLALRKAKAYRISYSATDKKRK